MKSRDLFPFAVIWVLGLGLLAIVYVGLWLCWINCSVISIIYSVRVTVSLDYSFIKSLLIWVWTMNSSILQKRLGDIKRCKVLPYLSEGFIMYAFPESQGSEIK